MRRAWLLALLSWPTAAQARFVRQDLAVPGSLLWVVTGDLDGDGQTDLVASYRRGGGPKAQRFMAVFFRTAEGYARAPDAAFAALKTAALFDVGDATGDGRDDLVYLAADGVYAQSFVERKPQNPARVLAVSSLVGEPEEEDLPAWELVRPVEPGGPPVLVVPARSALRLFKRDAEGWKPWSRVDVEQQSSYDAEMSTFRRDRRGGSSGRPYSLRVTVVMPVLDFVDQTGDGKADLVASYEDRLAVYPRLEDGTFSPSPKVNGWFAVRSAEELEQRDSSVNAVVQDVDQDGVADATVTKIWGGITTLRSETRLYRGLKGGGFADSPAQLFKEEGFAALVQFIDVDGDGRLEMVQPHSDVSIVGISQMMLKQELVLEVRVRRAAKAPLLFAEEPVQVVEDVFGLDLSVGATLRGTAPIFGHDFDGDGRKDVILSDGEDKLVLHRGLPAGEKAIFEEDPQQTLEAPGTSATLALSPTVDGKGRPDLLLYYVDRAALAGKLIVFKNSR